MIFPPPQRFFNSLPNPFSLNCQIPFPHLHPPIPVPLSLQVITLNGIRFISPPTHGHSFKWTSMFSRRGHVTILDYATMPLEHYYLIETAALWKPNSCENITMPISLLLWLAMPLRHQIPRSLPPSLCNTTPASSVVSNFPLLLFNPTF